MAFNDGATPEEEDGIALMFSVSNRSRLHIRFAFEKSLLNAKQYFSNDEISKITAAIVSQNFDNAGESKNPHLPYLKYSEQAKVDIAKVVLHSYVGDFEKRFAAQINASTSESSPLSAENFLSYKTKSTRLSPPNS